MKLSELKKGSYFRTIDKKGNVSKKTYIKDYYVRDQKKWCCYNAEDINDFKFIKGDASVTTEFEF